MRILVVTWDAAGGFPPQRTLIRGLAARGHDVHVAAHASLAARIEAAGARFERLAHIGDYDSRAPITPEREGEILRNLLFSEALGQDVYDLARRLQPDVQIVDLLMLSSAIAARAADPPVAFLTTTIFKFMDWLAGQYVQNREALQSFATRAGCELPATLMEFIGQSPVVAATYRPFEPPAAFPPRYLAVGPLRESPALDHPAKPFPRPSPAKPLVLTSLSMGFMNQAATLNALCQGLAQLPVEAVVTTGEAVDPRSLNAGSNTHVLRLLPHDVILPMTRLLVTHAGHGTVMAAIRYGVPVLLLPMGRDQRMVAARAAELGLGAVIDWRASAGDFAAAIERELADTMKPRRCRAFLRRLEGHPALADAVAAVESLAGASR